MIPPKQKLCSCDVCEHGRGWMCLGCASFYPSCPDHDAENCPACGEKVCPVDVLLGVRQSEP